MTIDSQDMISILKQFPDMVKQASNMGDDITVPKNLIDNIIVIGMGGSGYNGDLLKCYLKDLKIPIHVIKDYNLPKYANKKSLIFTVSYSGNTEETIEAYRSAIRKGINIVSLSSGGKLEELAKMNKNPHISVPKGIQPRLSTAYQFISMLNVLQHSGIISNQEKEIKTVIKNLKASNLKIETTGKELAKKIKNKIPIIYSSAEMFCVAEKWKTDINENAKAHAFYNTFSEFNNNELCAYEHTPDNFYIIIITDEKDHPRIKKRINIFKKLARSFDISITEISITGDHFLTRLLSSIWMGFFVAYYLAIEYERDPTPVLFIENLKKDLK
ncbi:bifunctional phosphoglucose/phosphomannose isomerase [archaeon]|nr:bifunctional phosphoglucose/phosphomannose isomerase [archaeon]